MKILTIFGTRPEIIRLSQVIRKLDAHADHVVVHTGQNNDPALSDVFFKELTVRVPDVHLGVDARDFAEQAAQILSRAGEVLARVAPDRVLVLGDTNSGLAAIVAARMGIPVYHMEAGNRCYDDRVPEELNRRIIDHSSTILMPYTDRSKENLIREGLPRERIFVIGNPIFGVIHAHEPAIAESTAMSRFGVTPGGFLLATLHRAENVDPPGRLARLFDGLCRIGESRREPLLVSVHPRTADRLKAQGIATTSSYVRLLRPLGFFDFLQLERNARAVLTDSGTVQEECCIFGIPNVTVRDVTERPETIECGSSILSGSEPENLERALRVALESGHGWRAPREYLEPDVSTTVLKILIGYQIPIRR